MRDSKIDHGLYKPIDSISVSEADELRRIIKIGDKYRIPIMIKMPGVGDTIKRWEKAKVTGIYPHLITVSVPGLEYPIKTITYVDILSDARYTLNV